MPTRWGAYQERACATKMDLPRCVELSARQSQLAGCNGKRWADNDRQATLVSGAFAPKEMPKAAFRSLSASEERTRDVGNMRALKSRYLTVHKFGRFWVARYEERALGRQV